MKSVNRLLKYAEISQMVGASRGTIWRWTKEGLFPSPVKLNGRIIGWSERDVTEWMESNKG